VHKQIYSSLLYPHYTHVSRRRAEGAVSRRKSVTMARRCPVGSVACAVGVRDHLLCRAWRRREARSSRRLDPWLVPMNILAAPRPRSTAAARNYVAFTRRLHRPRPGAMVLAPPTAASHAPPRDISLPSPPTPPRTGAFHPRRPHTVAHTAFLPPPRLDPDLEAMPAPVVARRPHRPRAPRVDSPRASSASRPTTAP